MADKAVFSLAQPPYRLPADEVARQLDTSLDRGLTRQEARRRHDLVGDNALEGTGGVSIFRVLFKQVANALTLVFILSAGVLMIRYWSWPWHFPTGPPISLKVV